MAASMIMGKTVLLLDEKTSAMGIKYQIYHVKHETGAIIRIVDTTPCEEDTIIETRHYANMLTAAAQYSGILLED